MSMSMEKPIPIFFMIFPMKYVFDIVYITEFIDIVLLFIIQILFVYGLDLNMLAEGTQTIQWTTAY